MTALSIRGMNYTVGTRETAVKSLTGLEHLQTAKDAAYAMMSPKQWPATRELGKAALEDVLHRLVLFCLTDPAHVRYDPHVAEEMDWQDEQQTREAVRP